MPDDVNAARVAVPPAQPTVAAAIPGFHDEREPETGVDAWPRPPAPPHLHNVTHHLSAATKSQLKSGPGVLKRVVVNTAPAGMNGVLTLRDGQQEGGGILAVITPGVGQLLALDYEGAFDDGLFAELVGAVPGDWTVVVE